MTESGLHVNTLALNGIKFLNVERTHPDNVVRSPVSPRVTHT